jgi:hypothetical protein
MAAQNVVISPDRLASADSPARSRRDWHPDTGPLPGGHALLDLSSAKVLRIPDAAPPFDGEVLLRKTPGTRGFPMAAPPAVAGSSVLDARKDATGGGNAVAREGQGQGEGHRGTPDGFGAGHPADRAWARQFARLLVETLAGARPLRQLLPWISDRARVQMRRVAPVLRSGQRPRVVRVLLSQPKHGVLEMTVIVTLGPRTRALALRLEAVRPDTRCLDTRCPETRHPEATRPTGARRPVEPSRWLCTEIEAALWRPRRPGGGAKMRRREAAPVRRRRCAGLRGSA